MNNAPSSNRRSFLNFIFNYSLMASAIGAGLLSGCSDGDNADSVNGFDTDGSCTDNGTTVDISVTHTPNHTLIISRDDVNAGATKTYTLENNGSGHTHTLTLTGDHFTALRNNVTLRLTSSDDAGHTHTVNIGCA